MLRSGRGMHHITAFQNRTHLDNDDDTSSFCHGRTLTMRRATSRTKGVESLRRGGHQNHRSSRPTPTPSMGRPRATLQWPPAKPSVTPPAPTELGRPMSPPPVMTDRAPHGDGSRSHSNGISTTSYQLSTQDHVGTADVSCHVVHKEPFGIVRTFHAVWDLPA